jgi:LmbE family N-acetylglucosaminyl deacetylase
MHLKRASFAIVVSVVLAALPSAQLRVRPIDLEDGAVAFGLILRQLNSTAVFMQATAHPDDENNALHVYLNRGQGARTVLATATRGDGGQNEIGPELYDPLAVLRTEELEAMHRFDASEQYFTRAIDFGYSFSIEETMEKWGRDEVLADYVRLIRMTRPDVVLGMNPTGTAGGLHHQASGLLSREAFKAAGDPSRYPEQIREGLMPWQPRKYYYPAGGPGGGRGQGAQTAAAGPLPLGALKAAAFDVSGFDALLGRTYVEIGTEERGMHKSQAMAQLLALPSGRTQQRYLLMESTMPATAGAEEPSFFHDLDTTIPGLAALVNETPPAALASGLRTIADQVSAAQKQFDLSGPFAAAPSIVAGLNAVRALRQQLATMGLTVDARFNLDARLKTKEDQFTEAALLAHGLRVEVLSDDGLVVPGQDVRVSISIGGRGRPITVSSVALNGFSMPENARPARSTSARSTAAKRRPRFHRMRE